jgi:hypothetical protein
MLEPNKKWWLSFAGEKKDTGGLVLNRRVFSCVPKDGRRQMLKILSLVQKDRMQSMFSFWLKNTGGCLHAKGILSSLTHAPFMSPFHSIGIHFCRFLCGQLKS